MQGAEARDGRRPAILAAAAELVAEGGYSALSIRALAERAGISLGLLYYYFADKHAVFAAMMQDHQRQMAEFLDDFDRKAGLEALLRTMLPIAESQWLHVGRLVAVWQVERTDDSAEHRARSLHAAAAQFQALGRALRETAAAQGSTLRPEPEIVPFVWSGLMGLADLRTHGWVVPIDGDRLVDLTLGSLLNQICLTDRDRPPKETTMPTRDDITRLCDTYMATVTSRDLDALMELFAPDAVQEEPVGSAPNVGREQIRAFFAATVDVPFSMERLGSVTVVGHRAVFQAHVRVDLPDGLREFTTSDVIRVDHECRIVELLAFPDKAADPFEAPATARAGGEA